MNKDEMRKMWEAAANQKIRIPTTSELTDPKRYAHLSPDRQKANVDAVKANMAKPENKIIQAKIDATAAKREEKKEETH